jgi:hypothetical protein
MRFTARALGALAAAGILVVTHPGAALAAEGNLYIGKKRIENPTNNRCYPYKRSPVRNSTTGYVAFYSGYGCTGRLTAILLPDSALLRVSARSLRVVGSVPALP